MKNKPIPEEQAYKDLDGALISIDTIDKSKLPNQNGYFLGAPFAFLGLILGIYGGTQFNVNDAGFYIYLVLGSLMFFPGVAFVIKATVYLLTWNKFLQSANLTTCNVFLYSQIYRSNSDPANRKFGRYYWATYTLKVYYIDIDGKKREKTVKYLTAHNLQYKMQSFFIAEGKETSLYGECIVAYNPKGKIRLIF